ncbi:MAG: DMT family transporter [Actinomycetota bacterium]
MGGQLVPASALLLAAAIWGFTFPLVKDALEEVTAFEFLAVRFVLASLVLAAMSPRTAKRALRSGRRAGLIVGLLLAFGHAFQTIGLDLTRSTNAGFITGLYVVFTPVIAAVVLRRRPTRLVIGGVALTTVGLVLLSVQVDAGALSVNLGDFLVLISAIVYGGQIVALGRYAPESDARVLTLQQLAVTAIFFLLLTPTQPMHVPTTWTVWSALLATAIGSTVFGISVQTWAQARISPTRAAVIFSMEAPFAALFAFLLADERLPAYAWVGAALIMTGVLAVQLRPGVATHDA